MDVLAALVAIFDFFYQLGSGGFAAAVWRLFAALLATGPAPAAGYVVVQASVIGEVGQMLLPLVLLLLGCGWAWFRKQPTYLEHTNVIERKVFDIVFGVVMKIGHAYVEPVKALESADSPAGKLNLDQAAAARTQAVRDAKEAIEDAGLPVPSDEELVAAVEKAVVHAKRLVGQQALKGAGA